MIRDLCNFLNIEFDFEMLKENYKRNTSFRSNNERKIIINFIDEWIIKIISSLFYIFPYCVYYFLHMVQNVFKKKKLPIWFYSIIKDEKFSKD